MKPFPQGFYLWSGIQTSKQAIAGPNGKGFSWDHLPLGMCMCECVGEGGKEIVKYAHCLRMLSTSQVTCPQECEYVGDIIIKSHKCIIWAYMEFWKPSHPKRDTNKKYTQEKHTGTINKPFECEAWVVMKEQIDEQKERYSKQMQ